MKIKLAATVLASFLSLGAQAQTEIQWWQSMGGALGEWVNDLAKDFNASQKEYKVVPTFKGTYDESWRWRLPLSAPATRRTFCRCLKWAPPP